MAKPHAMLLTGGGLRSLVALAMLRDERGPGGEPVRVTMLHLVDGREASPRRREHLRKQAEAYGVTRLTEPTVRHHYGHSYGKTADGRPRATLVWPRLLMEAMAEAKFQSAQRVVWPVSVQGDIQMAAKATEQAVLVEQMLAAEEPFEDRVAPRIEMPLLEMNDQEVLEVGAQLGVDWTLAWSCVGVGVPPDGRACGGCEGCRRRRAAFEKAGLVDEAEEVQQQPA
ncbi:MAG: 7-cyano-7-deazaguanine synthase [Planctomycetota bacterium]